MSLQLSPYTANQIAKFFIWKATQEGKSITNKKLQKLLYYAQAWNLVINNAALFPEKIEAWVHGPAIKSIYDEYKRFSHQPIDVEINEEEIKELKSNKLLQDVWAVYGKYDAAYLEMLTHNEEPWQIAREDYDPSQNSDREISLEIMKEYYTKLQKNASK